MFPFFKKVVSLSSYRTKLNCASCLKNSSFPNVIIRNNLTTTRSNLTTKSPLDVNTNVIKDVILYKYDNEKFFRYGNIFAMAQFIFWTYLGHFAYTSLKDVPVDKSRLSHHDSWYQKINLGENKYRNGLGIISLTIAFGILSTAWMFTLRSVRYLILHKGGQDVTFVTYSPLGHNLLMKVNLKHVSSQQTRSAARSTLPVKIRNKRFYYMLDMRGEFRNPQLFDNTAGLNRGF